MNDTLQAADRPTSASTTRSGAAGEDGLSALRLTATAFLLIATITGLILTLLTPPLQGPDEQQHFWRVYALSEGQVIPQRQVSAGGAILPKSVAALPGVVRMWDVAGHADRKFEKGDYRAGFALPLAVEDRA